MNCDAFRSCIDRMPTLSPKSWDAAARAHHEACGDCQAWLAREQTWQHVFSSVPAPRGRSSVWPGVMAAIASRRVRPASLSRELVALSRYVVPALAALVLALGSVGLWGPVPIDANAPATQPLASVLVAEPTTELAFLHQDADTILDQWVGVSQR
jgi:hypothetical protein